MFMRGETPVKWKRKLVERGRAQQEGLFASFIKDELIRKFDNKIGSYGEGGERKHLRRKGKYWFESRPQLRREKEDYEGTEGDEE